VPFWDANKYLGIRNPRSLLPHHPLLFFYQKFSSAINVDFCTKSQKMFDFFWKIYFFSNLFFFSNFFQSIVKIGNFNKFLFTKIFIFFVDADTSHVFSDNTVNDACAQMKGKLEQILEDENSDKGKKYLKKKFEIFKKIISYRQKDVRVQNFRRFYAVFFKLG